MKLVKELSKVTLLLKHLRRKKKRIGFVPTMGAFHEGHLSLIRKAKKENDIVVVSIFVNPTQFGKNEDYKKYPRAIKGDAQQAEKCGCDILFFPDAGSMYPKGFSTYVEVEERSDIMCKRSRPGHFKGVATVCTKLFNIIAPDTVYFGQKDYQQAFIIKKMVRDLNIDINVKVLPIVREKSGIALSSRNRYLTDPEMEDAKLLYKSLKKAKDLIVHGESSASKVRSAMKSILNKPNTCIDYIDVVCPDTLSKKRVVNSKVLIALAVKIGTTRLIDNMIIRHKVRVDVKKKELGIKN